jgi:hypothetical protein
LLARSGFCGMVSQVRGVSAEMNFRPGPGKPTAQSNAVIVKFHLRGENTGGATIFGISKQNLSPEGFPIPGSKFAKYALLIVFAKYARA